jgi:hypothetical protein
VQTPDALTELALERLDDEGLGQARTLLRLLALLPDSADSTDVDLLANACLLIGEVLAEEGRYGEAQAIGTAAVAETRRVLGSTHPRTRYGLTFLAAWTGRAGDAATARALFAELPQHQVGERGEVTGTILGGGP